MTPLELVSKFAEWLNHRDMNKIAFHISRNEFEVVWTEEEKSYADRAKQKEVS